MVLREVTVTVVTVSSANYMFFFWSHQEWEERCQRQQIRLLLWGGVCHPNSDQEEWFLLLKKLKKNLKKSWNSVQYVHSLEVSFFYKANIFGFCTATVLI